jgi:hypothetical protein
MIIFNSKWRNSIIAYDERMKTSSKGIRCAVELLFCGEI